MGADHAFDRFVEEVRQDDDVLGLVLGGSRGRGLVTEHSDWDCYLIVRDESLDRHRRRRGAHADIDVAVIPIADLQEYADPGTAFFWDRYNLARSIVVLDKLDGDITRLIEEKATYPPDAARADARDALDAYLNSAYRSLKSWRDGRGAAARLDAAESVTFLLTAVFAMQGRLRSYNKYLEWELTTHPLPSVPFRDPARLLDILQDLLTAGQATTQGATIAEVGTIADRYGFGDVFESWDDHFVPLAE